MVKTKILDKRQIEDKLRRIAFQIYEDNVDRKEIVIAGIQTNGFKLANMISAILGEISNLKVQLCSVVIDKENPLNEITVSISEKDYRNKSIVLIDDVLNSGSTLIYGVRHFLKEPISLFKTAVLVDRNHKKYPIKADYKGISLSTSLNEHVEVILKANEMSAHLKE